MRTPIGIVVTTILDPAFLPRYLENIEFYGWQGNTTFFIILDRKTPPSVYEAAEKALRNGFHIRCPDLEDQLRFLNKLNLPTDFIPWNTDNRRNVGFLMAMDANCEVIISIDDDNFCTSDTDFIGGHLVVGRHAADKVVTSSDGWFNNCSLLESDVPVDIFPRGFPYFARKNCRTIDTTSANKPPVVAVNGGLWLEDPDVDAITRLSLSPRAHAFKPPSVILDKDTWCPINSQNTALTREAASAFYYLRMGYPIQGIQIDRYGDILCGYLVQKCAKHLGQTVRFGTPVCKHIRTAHNVLNDLYHELAGIILLDELIPRLIELPLEGTSYFETYACLADHLAAASQAFKGSVWKDGGLAFLTATSKNMKIWLEAVKMMA